MKYTIEQIKNFTEAEYQEFRKEHWLEQQATYSDKNNVPDWYWPAQKEKDNEIRRKAWVKKCNKFAASNVPPSWYIPVKADYILFLEKKETKKLKIAEKQQSK